MVNIVLFSCSMDAQIVVEYNSLLNSSSLLPHILNEFLTILGNKILFVK